MFLKICKKLVYSTILESYTKLCSLHHSHKKIPIHHTFVAPMTNINNVQGAEQRHWKFYGLVNSDWRAVEFQDHFQMFCHTLRPCRSFRHLYNFVFFKKTSLHSFRRKYVKNDSFCCRATIIVLYLKVRLACRKCCLTNNELP